MAVRLPSISTTSYASFSPIKPQPKPPPNPRPKPRLPPLTISTRRAAVDPLQLQRLFSSCSYSCHRFSNPTQQQPVDLGKLRIAIENSFVLVSVFCKERFLEAEENNGGGDSGLLGFQLGDLFDGSEKRLVGFGRAVSDCGLTASIHDVVVIPSLRRRGIGRKIIDRIVRVLKSREIYDVSALCTENESLFFEACEFGDDSLGSTTMMYTRSPETTTDSNDGVVTAGRLRLLVPPPTHHLKLWKKQP